MVLIPVEGETCSVCDEQIVLNCVPSIKKNAGVCNSCGLPYSIDGDLQSKVIRNLEPTMDVGEGDRPLIEEYYALTGEPATIVGYCDFDVSVIDAFCQWANEKYDMYWGMTLEEIEAETPRSWDRD